MDGLARLAVRVDRLAPKRMTGTPNACRHEEALRDGSMCGGL
jgi:hypothetical protein